METRTMWQQRGIILIIILLMSALALPAVTFAQKGEGKGPPAGKGNRGGSKDEGIREGSLYGEPWVVIRDLSPEADGKPVGFSWIWPDYMYTPDGELEIGYGAIPDTFEHNESGGCIQPFSFEPLPELGELFQYDWIDLYGNSQTVYLIPLDDECKIPEVYESVWGDLAEEIDAGRLNFARTTQWVIDSAYGKALEAINAATVIGLDPAGRLTLDGKTIDSPRENLALYQKLMLEGCLAPLPDIDIALDENGIAALSNAGLSCLVCAEDAPIYSDELFQHAASFFAGAADKFGRILIDHVIFINSVLGINDIEVTDEGIIYVQNYFDFGSFRYDRGLQHQGTTARLLQGGPVHFYVENDLSIYGKIFRGDWVYPGGPDGNPYYPVLNFARAADDALSTIFYIHNYEVPETIEGGVID